MSVLYGREAGIGPAVWQCSECGRRIRRTAPVYWFGALVELLLHPACATRLGVHLIADAREATLAGNPQPHWRQRSVAVVRHRLLAEEAVA